TVADMARERNMDPVELMIDLALAKDFDQFFIQPFVNELEDEVLQMLKYPYAVPTFSDSGAHVSQIMDSSLQTHFLSYWVREKQEFTFEQAIRMMTFNMASNFGFSDRGLLRVGYAADL